MNSKCGVLNAWEAVRAISLSVLCPSPKESLHISVIFKLCSVLGKQNVSQYFMDFSQCFGGAKFSFFSELHCLHQHSQCASRVFRGTSQPAAPAWLCSHGQSHEGKHCPCRVLHAKQSKASHLTDKMGLVLETAHGEKVSLKDTRTTNYT